MSFDKCSVILSTFFLKLFKYLSRRRRDGRETQKHIKLFFKWNYSVFTPSTVLFISCLLLVTLCALKIFYESRTKTKMLWGTKNASLTKRNSYCVWGWKKRADFKLFNSSFPLPKIYFSSSSSSFFAIRQEVSSLLFSLHFEPISTWKRQWENRDHSFCKYFISLSILSCNMSINSF